MSKEKEIIEDAYTITAAFDMQELSLKKDGQWHMKVMFKDSLPETFREYAAALVLDETPWKEQIEQLERNREDINGKENLFDGDKKKELANIDKDIVERKKDLKKALEENKPIEMKFTIEQLAYKEEGVALAAIIPAEIIGTINERRQLISKDYYQLQLTH